jgi:hypothetical protein
VGGVILRARLTAAHEPPPGEPLEFQAGDPLRMGEESVEYPAWWRATSADGRTGWAPESHVRIRGARGSAVLDYTARELHASVAETVGVIQELFGWAWCETADGRTGWLPLEKLGRLSAG